MDPYAKKLEGIFRPLSVFFSWIMGPVQRGRHIKSTLSVLNLCKGMSLDESGSQVTSYKISVLSVNTVSLFLLCVAISPIIREGVNVAPFDGYALY